MEEQYQSASQRFTSSLDATLHALQNAMKPYPKYVSQHLARVYGTMIVLCAFAALGVCVNMYLNIGGYILQCLSLITSLYLIFTPGSVQRFTVVSLMRRGSILALDAFIIGCSLAPLIAHVIHVDPSILFSAILLTASTFVFLTLSAILAERRAFFVLGSLISTSVGLLSLSALFSIFIPSLFSFDLHLYLGLLVACASVLYSTQLIAERAVLCGDYILNNLLFLDDALRLFWIIIDIFVRILIILLENSNKDRRKNERKR
jgi:hypothetical protein